MSEENPKDIAGSVKLPFADIPGIVLAEVGLAMHEGARKYGAFNYRQTPIAASAYYSAAQRHLTQWWELGEDVDATCQLSHITKAIACLMVLRDAQINARCKDDRPPAVNSAHWQHLEFVADQMRAKYPEPKARVTEWGDEMVPTKYTPQQANAVPKSVRLLYPGLDTKLADVEAGQYFEPPVAGYTR